MCGTQYGKLPLYLDELLNSSNKFLNKFEDSTRENSPEIPLSMGLWAVSEYTQIVEEVLVYPFESFVAEFGGALGLFLGVSFMTIWDGIRSVISLGKAV